MHEDNTKVNSDLIYMCINIMCIYIYICYIVQSILMYKHRDIYKCGVQRIHIVCVMGFEMHIDMRGDACILSVPVILHTP